MILGSPSSIRSTAFGSYPIPGVVLLVVLGVGSFVGLYGIVRRTAWAWPAGVTLGVAALIRILVRIAVLRRATPL